MADRFGLCRFVTESVSPNRDGSAGREATRRMVRCASASSTYVLRAGPGAMQKECPQAFVLFLARVYGDQGRLATRAGILQSPTQASPFSHSERTSSS